MKVGNDICIICRGSGAVTQEHICPECDGLGYIKVVLGRGSAKYSSQGMKIRQVIFDEGVNNDGKSDVQEHSEESGRDDRRNHSKNG